MDCVSCGKCKVWGKLQILGIGTAIKVLLSSREDISAPDFFSRQEVIALINVFRQFSESVLFASRASEVELEEKIGVLQVVAAAGLLGVLLVSGLLLLRWWRLDAVKSVNKRHD